MSGISQFVELFLHHGRNPQSKCRSFHPRPLYYDVYK
jgi:hypothetical protein